MLQNQKINFHSFIKFGLIPTLMIIVVMIHFYHIRQGLSPWKGGGFGMYSTYRPMDSHLYVNGVYINNSNSSVEQRAFLRNYMFYPNEKNRAILIQSFANLHDTLHIEIWQPKFDVKTATYKTILKYKRNYVKPKSQQ